MSKAAMIVIALVIIFFFLLTSLWGFYVTVRPPKLHSTITPQDLGVEFEPITFKTDDNISLSGWFIPTTAENAKTVILLHGYPADKGNILPSLLFLNEQYNLLLFDFRYLGESEGSYSTIGAKETKDLQAAISYLNTRGINQVGIWGFSMGGAVALMTAPSSPAIKAIISESSYAQLDQMVYQLYRLPILKYPLGWLTNIWAQMFLGINASATSPAQSVRSLTIPIFIIHSPTDEVIPFSNAKKLQDALTNNTQAEFWFTESLRHGQLSDEYQQRVNDFFAKNL